MSPPDPQTALQGFWYVLGSGGLATVIIAFIGLRRGARADGPAIPEPPRVPIQIESPWLVQTLTRIQDEQEHMHGKLEALVSSVTALTIQINLAGKTLARIDRRSRKQE